MNAKRKLGLISIEIIILGALLVTLISLLFPYNLQEFSAVSQLITGNIQTMDIADSHNTLTAVRQNQIIHSNQRVLSDQDSSGEFELLDGQAYIRLEPLSSVVFGELESWEDTNIIQINVEVGETIVSTSTSKISIQTPSGSAFLMNGDSTLRISVDIDTFETDFNCMKGSCFVENEVTRAILTAGQNVSIPNKTADWIVDQPIYQSTVPDTVESTDIITVQPEVKAAESDNVIRSMAELSPTPTTEILQANNTIVVEESQKAEEVVPTKVQKDEDPQTDQAVQPSPTVEPPQPTTIPDQEEDHEIVEIPDQRAIPYLLAASNWELSSYGASANLTAVPEGLILTFQYNPSTNTITGQTGCASFTGTATVGTSTIQISNLKIQNNKMVCGTGAIQYSNLYISLIEQLTKYIVTADNLVLTTAMGWELHFDPEHAQSGNNTRPPEIPTPVMPPTAVPPSGIYYVDQANGSDNNTGTQAKPWKTIQKAANTLSAGETVIVNAGNYSERVYVNRSGTSSASIKFKTQGTVVMRGFTIRADYIEINGFEITNTPNDSTDGRGIYVEGKKCVLVNNYIHYTTRGGILLYAEPGKEDDTSGCLVKNNRLYRNSQNGIDVRGKNHVIESNEIWATIQYHPSWTNAPSYVDADGIRFFGSGHTFRANYIHDITLDAPENVNPHIDGFQTWDESLVRAGSNCLFERNTIDLGRTSTAFQLEGGTHDLTIRNNIIAAYGGIRSYKNGQSPVTTPYNFYIYNNLFIGKLSYKNDGYPVGMGIRETSNVIIKNNMLVNQTGAAIYLENDSGVDMDYNLFFNTDGSTPDATKQAHDLWMVDPKFIDIGAGNYHLQNNSQAINAGINVPVSNDFDGNSRPTGGAYDIGAFEFQP